MAELRFREDEPHEEPAVTLDAFLDQSNASAVRIEKQGARLPGGNTPSNRSPAPSPCGGSSAETIGAPE